GSHHGAGRAWANGAVCPNTETCRRELDSKHASLARQRGTKPDSESARGSSRPPGSLAHQRVTKRVSESARKTRSRAAGAQDAGGRRPSPGGGGRGRRRCGAGGGRGAVARPGALHVGDERGVVRRLDVRARLAGVDLGKLGAVKENERRVIDPD